MKPIRTFTVIPRLPPQIETLRELAHNLRWAWSHATIDLFRRLDGDLWESTGHNPVLMLGRIDQARLEAAAADDAFLSHLEGVHRHFRTYLAGDSTWYRRIAGAPAGPLVAYFSAEFGVTECLSIFAGGLGVLAGDCLKSGSDLGVPVVGVGILYQQGYFRQQLNEAGWQQEIYEDNDFYNLPLLLERATDGRPVTVRVPFPGREATAQVWRAQVGRVPLYLLDTNVPGNPPEDRDVTDQLYGGDLELRMRQEIVLGIGGYRALQILGLEPPVCHMNEGHSAFLALERVRRLMERCGLSFPEAREAASAGLLFTTHTPVAAGHDRFPPELTERYFAHYARALGLPWKEFLALGQEAPGDGPFTMTVLALRMASRSNAVSRLHGQTARRMWQSLWPGVPVDEIPIESVSNGVHFRSWISREMDQLYDRYLGPRWRDEPADESVWARASQIPAEELWRTHERRRERLIVFARRRLRAQLEARGAPRSEVEAADEALNPDALTIGCGRRFATYKRATLLLRDPQRLARILGGPARPAQILFAGKAHPRDAQGKELIQRIVQASRQEPFRGRMVFLEDYDMAVSRYLVQGSDVWLNVPRRPLEASGTSGMKAAANGVLNLSTLDGWWDEAWQAWGREPDPVGWAIGRGEVYDDPEEQDRVEGEALYELLEQDVIPTFYDRGADGLPRRWIARMKASMGRLCHYFNSHRMAREYIERLCLPTAARYAQLTADGTARARRLAAWKSRVRQNWPQVRVDAVESGVPVQLEAGGEVGVRARLRLGALTPDDVRVQLYLGRVDPQGELTGARPVRMEAAGGDGPGRFVFEARSVPCPASGLHGYTVRVLPDHPDLVTPFLPGLITWADVPGTQP